MRACAAVGVLLALLPVARRAAEFEAKAQPVLEKYCVECHGGNQTKGDVDLTVLKSDADLEADQQLLLDIVAQLDSYAMPPAKAEPLPDAERQVLSASLTQAIDAIDARAPKNPGRTPLHRLNGRWPPRCSFSSKPWFAKTAASPNS